MPILTRRAVTAAALMSVAGVPCGCLELGDGLRDGAASAAPAEDLTRAIPRAEAGYAVDRRPAKLLNMQNTAGWNSAEFLNDRRDNNRNGVPDGFDALLRERLEAFYAQGWRRFILNRTTGDLSISWEEMSAHQKQGYLTAVRAWALAHPDASVEAYIRLDGVPARVEPGDADAYERLMSHVEPWHRAGFAVVWVDEGFKRWPALARLNRDERLRDGTRGVRTDVGAEAASVALRDGRLRDDLPWMAATQNPVWKRAHGGLTTPIDPRRASAGVWLGTAAYGGVEGLYGIARSGKWVTGHGDDEAIRRVFEFGVLERPADFDADGTITPADAALFRRQFDRAGKAADPTFFEGDYNRDGRVDEADWQAFRRDFTAGGGGAIDFGASRQPPVWE